MKPILFSTEMVKAILDGRKTQTRRVIKPQLCYGGYDAFLNDEGLFELCCDGCFEQKGHVAKCPYGKVGDRLWVRETHYLYGKWIKNGISKTGRQKWKFKQLTENCKYFDNPPKNIKTNSYRKIGWYKRPSIFMLRKYARLIPEITDIRVERVQDISYHDAIAEGIYRESDTSGYQWYKNYAFKSFPAQNAMLKGNPINSFITLWDSINKKRGYGWKVNPWVWVVCFKVVKK